MPFTSFVNFMIDLDGITSTNEKKKIIAEYLDQPHVNNLLNLALSPFITFGVKNFELPSQFSQVNASDQTFLDLAQKLRDRELTGGSARDTIRNVLSLYTEDTATILARVLRQDLKNGIAVSLINKAAGRSLVDDFDVQLADKMSDKFDWDGGSYFVEYKYDGMRLPAHVDVAAKTVVYRSRDGRIQENVPQHITDQLLDAARQLIANSTRYNNDVMFDGEIISQSEDGKESYHGTMSMMKSTKAKDRSTLRYRMFDVMQLAEFAAQECNVPFLERRGEVQIACGNRREQIDFTNSFLTHVLPSNGKLCNTANEIKQYYGELLTLGSEGAIIKKPNSLYLWKRSRDWTKLKPVFTADLKCVGVYEGDELNGFKGTLGGLLLEGTLDNVEQTYVECKCGSGFKTKPQPGQKSPTRDEIWANPALVVGHTIEVEYQEVTIAKNKEVSSLRFVIFKHIRTDK